MKPADKRMTDVSGVKPALGPGRYGVEVYPRSSDANRVFILVNLSKGEQTVSLPSQMQDVLEGGTKNSVILPIYGVAVGEKKQEGHLLCTSWPSWVLVFAFTKARPLTTKGPKANAGKELKPPK